MKAVRPARDLGPCLCYGPNLLASDLIGRTSIIEGDTLEIHCPRICLWGIDAPGAKSSARRPVIDPWRDQAAGPRDI